MPVDRVIRRVPYHGSAPLDERPWVVQLVIAMWVGLLVMIALSAGGFDDPRFLHNGVVRLAAIGVLWGLAAWYAHQRRATLGRRMRLAVACSLVAHTLLAVLLVLVRLELLVIELPDELSLVRSEPIVQPEVTVVNQPRPEERPAYERPVPTEQLTAESPQASREQTSPSHVEMSNEVDPAATELAEMPAPALQAQPRAASAVAHRGPAPGQRSRQVESAQAAQANPTQVAAATPTENLRDQSSPSPTQPRERVTPVVSSATDQPAPQSGATQATVATVARNELQRADRPTPQPRPDRQVATAGLAGGARAARASETTPAAQVARDTTLEASRGQLAKQQPELPTDRPEAAEVDLPRPQAPTEMARRSTDVPDMRLAQSPRRESQRGPVEIATPSEQPLETARTATAADLASETLADRTPTAMPKSTQLDRVADAAAVETLRPTPSAGSIPRANRTATSAPSTTETARSRSMPSATIAAASPQPTRGQSPTAAASTLPEATSPASHALADTRGGTANSGDGMNSLDDAPAAPTYVAPFSAAAAQRPRASQTRLGRDISPVPVVNLQRGRATAAMPSSTTRAEMIPDAQVAGTRQPQETNASSSAGRTQQFANIPLGDINADRGEGSVDTGPPQITPRSGTGRGSRGGRMAAIADASRSGAARSGSPGSTDAANQPGGASGVSSPANPGAPGSATGSQTVDSRTRQSGGAIANSGPGRPSTSDVRRLRVGNGPVGLVSGGGQVDPIASTAGAPSGGAATTPTESTGLPGQPNRSALAGRFAGGSPAPMSAAASESPGAAQGTGRLAGPPSIASSRAGRGAMSGGANPSDRSGNTSTGRGLGLAAAVAMAQPAAIALLPPVAPGDGGGTSTANPSPRPASGGAGESRGMGQQPLLVDQPLGPGGLLDVPSRDPGLPTRVARADSRIPRITSSRFAGSSPRGRTGTGLTRRAAPAFAARGVRQRELLRGGADLPTPTSEEAIELGLRFLANAQKADGRWSLDYLGPVPVPTDELTRHEADVAATGLALLAFLGAGYDHFDSQYRQTVAEGLDFLVMSQHEDGLLLIEVEPGQPSVTRYYEHGIATIALCEAYGMTGDPRLAEPAQMALDYIIDTQHRQLGGWRYIPGRESDLSVTGWQLMALRSGELAGLEVDPNVYRRVRQFLERCRETEDNEALFCYNPTADTGNPETRHGRRPGTVMTSVGLLVQLYLGEGRDSARARLGADHLLKQLPKHGEDGALAPFSSAGNPLRDTYYWYYGTQVMFHMRGEYWKAWHDALHPLLVENQTKEGPLAGSWNPQWPAPDRWAGYGRLYVTTMNLLSLEVSYRHLPLYEMAGE